MILKYVRDFVEADDVKPDTIKEAMQILNDAENHNKDNFEIVFQEPMVF